MINTFKDFLDDKQARSMYVTGRAGTGKTTALHEAVTECLNRGLAVLACAHTHKACGVMQDKLPKKVEIKTLHSFLKRRPFVNTDAIDVANMTGNTKGSVAKKLPRILFVDEYSTVGEEDYMSIVEYQDGVDPLIPKFKVVYIGDPYQLPPVNSRQTVNPKGKYTSFLSKVWRQDDDNPLKDTIEKVVSFIEGKPLTKLEPNSNFLRDVDIAKEYKKGMVTCADKVMLAYTNKAVQELNARAEGKTKPELFSKVRSPTAKKTYSFNGYLPSEEVSCIIQASGSELYINSKYRTLEHLKQNGTIFASLIDEDGEEEVRAVVFGHYNYKVAKEKLQKTATRVNKEIELKFRGFKAVGWCIQNPETSLARSRAKAWRNYLSFDENVVCIDFDHAMTVHNSQGSTYKDVYLDAVDLSSCLERNEELYLRLMYVALSRASETVYSN